MPAVAVIPAVLAFTGVSAAIGTTVAAAVGLGTVGAIAATAIGTGVVAGTISAAEGNNAGQVLQDAVVGGASSYIGGTIGQGISDIVGGGAGGATVSDTGTIIPAANPMGLDPSQMSSAVAQDVPMVVDPGVTYNQGLTIMPTEPTQGAYIPSPVEPTQGAYIPSSPQPIMAMAEAGGEGGGFGGGEGGGSGADAGGTGQPGTGSGSGDSGGEGGGSGADAGGTGQPGTGSNSGDNGPFQGKPGESDQANAGAGLPGGTEGQTPGGGYGGGSGSDAGGTGAPGTGSGSGSEPGGMNPGDVVYGPGPVDPGDIGSTIGGTIGSGIGAGLGGGGSGSGGGAVAPVNPSLGPLHWGNLPDLPLPGLNPGFIQAQPFYHDTSPVQAQYYWGNHPFMNTAADLPNYNNIPNAPAQPWGLQQSYQPINLAQYLAALNQTGAAPAVAGPVAPPR